MKVNTSFSYETSGEEEVQIQRNASELVQNFLMSFVTTVIKAMEKSFDINTSSPPADLFTKGRCPNKSDPKSDSKPGHEYDPDWAEGIE